jgi:cyclic beta-1,2-glucan synthetase
VSKQQGSVFDHCVKAIDKGLTVGAHGLPLIGSGDWNDGLNRVGAAGRGESTWLGFFLHSVLMTFAPICDAQGDTRRAERYRLEANRLRTMLDLSWDGDWYTRGYYDDGTPLGSMHSAEGTIDSIAQSARRSCGVRSRSPQGLHPGRPCTPPTLQARRRLGGHRVGAAWKRR